MTKFVLYTVIGTLVTFAIVVYLSLLPHLMELPSFREGVTVAAVFGEYHAFLLTLALSWIAWWSVSGMLALILYSIGKHNGVLLFVLSVAVVTGITVLIT